MSLSLKQDVKSYLYENYNGHFLSFGITVEATKAVLKNIIKNMEMPDDIVNADEIYGYDRAIDKIMEVLESKF